MYFTILGNKIISIHLHLLGFNAMPRRIPDYLDLLIRLNFDLLCNHTRACIFESVSIPRCNPSPRTFKFDVSSLVGNCLSGVEAYLEVPLASRREENSEIRATSERETRF